MPSDFLYQEATSADVPAMARCRAADPDAGPADERMARYLDGHHHPQQALPPRTAFMAVSSGEVVGYIAGHATTRLLPPSGSESKGSESKGSESRDSGTADSDPNACEGEVQYLYVAPGARRRGVASQLLRLLGKWFDDRGIRRVCVNADVDSPGATPFYVATRARFVNRHWYIWDDIRTLASPEGMDGLP